MFNFNKKITGQYLLIFIPIFLLASTQTLPVLLGLFAYCITLVLVLFIALIRDTRQQTRYRFVVLKLCAVSVVAIALGISSFSFQAQRNHKRATAFIQEIEDYKSRHGSYPPSEKDIEIPTSWNGLYGEKFQYFPDDKSQSYTVRYFDGFWDSKVYIQEEKTWYNDD